MQELLENSTQVGFEGINVERWTSSETEERRSLALAKAESKTGDQVRDFSGHLRVSVREARTQAAPWRNFL